MSLFSKIKSFFNKEYLKKWVIRYSFIRFFISDKKAISLLYKDRFGRKINLENPKTFNEKIIWLTLYNREEIQQTMVDKIKAKSYIADCLKRDCLDADCLIPTLFVFDNPSKIDFTILPNRFVIKTNHGSGGVVVCFDKSTMNKKEALNTLKKSFKYNYFYFSREWAYKNIKKRVLVERLIDIDPHSPEDYKFFCFNGEPKFFLVTYNRRDNLKIDFYDIDLNRIPVTRGHPNSGFQISVPKCFSKMIEIAKSVSKGHVFLRVDFFVDKNDNCFIGELTLTPGSGLVPFSPDCYDAVFGDYISLPSNNKHD